MKRVKNLNQRKRSDHKPLKGETLLTTLADVFDLQVALSPAGVEAELALIVVVLTVGAADRQGTPPAPVHPALSRAVTLGVPPVLCRHAQGTILTLLPSARVSNCGCR